MGRGEDSRKEAEEAVVESGDGEEEEERMEEKGEELRWVKLLPRMPVRVLLVEGDDSTRQIIAALLRKCSYRGLLFLLSILLAILRTVDATPVRDVIFLFEEMFDLMAFAYERF